MKVLKKAYNTFTDLPPAYLLERLTDYLLTPCFVLSMHIGLLAVVFWKHQHGASREVVDIVQPHQQWQVAHMRLTVLCGAHQGSDWPENQASMYWKALPVSCPLPQSSMHWTHHGQDDGELFPRPELLWRTWDQPCPALNPCSKHNLLEDEVHQKVTPGWKFLSVTPDQDLHHDPLGRATVCCQCCLLAVHQELCYRLRESDHDHLHLEHLAVSGGGLCLLGETEAEGNPPQSLGGPQLIWYLQHCPGIWLVRFKSKRPGGWKFNLFTWNRERASFPTLQDYARWKPGVRNSLQVSNMGVWGPGTWPILCCFPGCFSRELERKQHEQDLKLLSYTGWWLHKQQLPHLVGHSTSCCEGLRIHLALKRQGETSSIALAEAANEATELALAATEEASSLAHEVVLRSSSKGSSPVASLWPGLFPPAQHTRQSVQLPLPSSCSTLLSKINFQPFLLTGW